jgi:predicted Ser/Thr protein kinase
MTSRQRQEAPTAPGDLTSAPGGLTRLLARGYQGAVYLAETKTGPVIIKKAMGRGLIRAARRAMLRREHAIYARLSGIAGIPACYGLEHGDELVLDFIDGQSLRQANQSAPERELFFSALLELIQAIHRAGVAHGDLKRKDNILLGRDGQPYVIDFGTAIAAPPGCGYLRRKLFELVCRIDLNAWVKLKYQGNPIPVSPADMQYHRPTLPERVARIVREPWRRATLRRWRKLRR